MKELMDWFQIATRRSAKSGLESELGDLHALPSAAGADQFRARAGLGVNPAVYLACSVTLSNLCKLTEPHYLISKMRKMILIALTS